MTVAEACTQIEELIDHFGRELTDNDYLEALQEMQIRVNAALVAWNEDHDDAPEEDEEEEDYDSDEDPEDIEGSDEDEDEDS